MHPQGGSLPKVAVQALSMAIERGEVFGLLGPNGAGKTSAINMMIGLLEPSSGAYHHAVNRTYLFRRKNGKYSYVAMMKFELP